VIECAKKNRKEVHNIKEVMLDSCFSNPSSIILWPQLKVTIIILQKVIKILCMVKEKSLLAIPDIALIAQIIEVHVHTGYKCMDRPLQTLY